MPKSEKQFEEEMELLQQWIECYKPEIKEVSEKGIDFGILLIFSHIEEIKSTLDNYTVVDKGWTKLPIDIMIDENKGYTFTKTPLVVVCLDDNNDYLGVVSVEKPTDALFNGNKYNYLKQEISQWIEKYKDDIKKVADEEMETSEFIGKLEYDDFMQQYN